MRDKLRVTVWNEYLHKKRSPEIARIYPQGMHSAIAGFLRTQPDMEMRTATLDEPEHGLTSQVLEDTDVLIWWAHMANHSEILIQADVTPDRFHQVYETAFKYRNITQGEKQ